MNCFGKGWMSSLKAVYAFRDKYIEEKVSDGVNLVSQRSPHHLFFSLTPTLASSAGKPMGT